MGEIRVPALESCIARSSSPIPSANVLKNQLMPSGLGFVSVIDDAVEVVACGARQGRHVKFRMVSPRAPTWWASVGPKHLIAHQCGC